MSTGMLTFKVLDVRAGMTSLLPDFLMLCVCAKTGLDLTTREHFAAALALDIPVFCVVTKTDIVSAIELERTLRALRLLLTAAADAGTTASVPVSVTGASVNELSECEEQPRRPISKQSSQSATHKHAGADMNVSHNEQLHAAGGEEPGGAFNTDDHGQWTEERPNRVWFHTNDVRAYHGPKRRHTPRDACFCFCTSTTGERSNMLTNRYTWGFVRHPGLTQLTAAVRSCIEMRQ